MRKRILASLLVAAMVMVGFSGMAQGAPSVDKDHLTVIIPDDFTTLDPYMTSAMREINFVANIYDPLTYTTLEGTECLLADSWEASDDGLHYTFHLRDGVKFHNGDPVTVEDVLYSMTRYIEEEWMTPYSFMIENAEKIDDQTVQVNLKFPYGAFMSLMNYFLISNEAYMTEKGDQAAQEPMGTGAYKFVAWNVGQSVELEANEDYFLGAPPIKNLTMKIVTDPNTAYVSMETGEADMYFNPNPMDYDQAVMDGVLGTDDRISAMYYYVAFNTNRIPKEVRQALCYTVDKEELNILCTDGTGTVVQQPMLEGQEGYVEGLENYPKDLDKARELLDAAGIPEGTEFTFLYGETTQNKKLAEALQSAFAQVGINLIPESVEVGSWFQLFGEGNYDISRGGYPMEEACTDMAYYDMYHGEGGTFNVSQVNDPTLNEMLENGRKEQDPEKRDEIYKEVTEYVNEEAIQLPAFYSRSAVIFNKELKGVSAIANERYIYADYSWE